MTIGMGSAIYLLGAVLVWLGGLAWDRHMAEKGHPERLIGMAIYLWVFLWPVQAASGVVVGIVVVVWGAARLILWPVGKSLGWIFGRAIIVSSSIKKAAMRRENSLREADELIARISRELAEERRSSGEAIR